MRSAVLIFNPKSGRQVAAHKAPRVEAILREGGFDLTLRPTAGPGDATRLAREAAADSIEVAFAMGGDGTLREVASGLLGTHTALGPLPAGTTNVLALALGIPREAEAAARIVVESPMQEIDVGRVAGEPFLMLASCGLDAAVMAHQDGRWKKHLGKVSVGLTAARQWLSYDYPTYRLRVGDHEVLTEFFAACNIPFYAGSFRLAPHADFTDRRLDLVTFSGHGRLATLSLARDLALGRHVGRKDVDVVRIESVTVESDEAVLFQVDGDVITAEPPVEIGLFPERLRVLMPAPEAPVLSPA